MTPEALLAHLSKPKRSSWCSGNMLGSKSNSLQTPVHQNKGYSVEDAILVDDDSDTDSGESEELEILGRWKDYVNLENYGREKNVERRVRALEFEPLEDRSRLSSTSRNTHGEHNSETQSDAGGRTQKTPLTYMCSAEQGTHSENTYPPYETTNGVDTKTDSNQKQPCPSKSPFSQRTSPESLARPQEKSEQSERESQAKVKAVAASPKKSCSNLARERAEKELAEQAAQCFRNEDKDGQSVDKALRVLALKKSSEEDTSTVSIETLDHRPKKEASTIASQCDLHASPAAQVSDVGPSVLAEPHKTIPSPLDEPNLHTTAPIKSRPGSTALQNFSDISSSSKSTQDRTVSSVPFGTLILERATAAKLPITPTEGACNPSDGLNPQTATPFEPKCGFATFSTTSKGPSSAKKQRVRDFSDLSPASSTEEQSKSTEKLRALQYGQIVFPTGLADPKRGSAILPASKANIKPKDLNGIRSSIKDLPPPLPVFDSRRKRPLSQIPMGELFRPDQVVSRQGYHGLKRRRQQEKKKAARHIEKDAGVQTVTDATWATMGDVYGTSVQGSIHQEPPGKLGLMDATLAHEGEKSISDNDKMSIVDPDAQIGEAGSKSKLSVSHLGPPFTRSLPKPLSSQVTKERSRKRSCNRMIMKEYSRAARELEPTHVCGVFTPSKVPQGQDPIQLIPRFCLNGIEKCKIVCIICEGKFDGKRTLRNHFPKCVNINGNPESYSWFNHQSVKRSAKRVATRPKRITTEHQKPDFAELSVSESDAISIDGTKVTFKLDKQTSTEPPVATPQPTLQEDAKVYSDFDRVEETMPAPAAHPNTGKKSITEATLAKWAAEEDEDADEEEDGMSDIELETPDIAYRYYVKRYEWPINQLEEQHTGDAFGPFYTMNEANILAEQEIHRLDSDPVGNYPRNWRHICEQDEVELIPPLSLRPLPTHAFTTPLRIYAVRTLFWDSIAAETTDYGCYTILNLANRRAGELWLDDAKGCLPEQSVKKDEMGMHLRRDLEILEREGECFDRDLSDGKGGRKRFWVVGLEVGGPRN